jgi:endo-1,4-beta-mannosidase
MITRRSFATGSMMVSAAVLAARSPWLNAAIPQRTDARSTRFGVNYVPRKRWWYCWLDWDQQSILEDLSGVAELGLDHIRIQCLWPIFQPGISSVSEHALANLHLLLDAADKVGLDVEVTVLNGWMSGLSFIPPWVAPLADPWHDKSGNMFTDTRVIEGEKLLFKKIAETVGGHRRFLGFDVGNELGVLMTPGSNPASTAAADAWATEMLRYCDEIAPGKFHVNGIDHSHWFNDFGFSRENVATTGHASVVHSYILFDGVLDHYKYSDSAALHLAEFEVELACAYHTDLSRQVWVEETGFGDEVPDSYKPEFMEQSVRNMMATGKVWGVTWWCSHDIDPSIRSFDKLEYTLGLLDLNNRPKPAGRKFAELAAEFKRSQPESAPRKTALVIPDRGLSTSAWPPDWKYATPYMNLIDRGVRPAIVLESRAKDTEYLKARGIVDLVPLTA